MYKDVQELLQLIVDNMATKDDIQILTSRLDRQEEKINDLPEITLNLEKNLTTRLDSLFDGYKLTHEKQWELERKMEQLEKRLEALEIRTA